MACSGLPRIDQSKTLLFCSRKNSEHPYLFKQSLRLLAQSFRTADEKLPELIKFLRQHKGSSIVYVQTHDVGYLYGSINFD